MQRQPVAVAAQFRQERRGAQRPVEAVGPAVVRAADRGARAAAAHPSLRPLPARRCAILLLTTIQSWVLPFAVTGMIRPISASVRIPRVTACLLLRVSSPHTEPSQFSRPETRVSPIVGPV